MSAILVTHPLVTHKINMLRKKNISTKEFEEISVELTSLLIYEATRDLPLETKEISCWSGKVRLDFIAGKKFTIIPILRAGLGMIEGVKRIVPVAKTGYIGIYRSHENFEAIQYYQKMPNSMEKRIAFILDPMLATGNTMVKAIDIVKEKNCKDIRVISFVVASEGLNQIKERHPDIKIFFAAKDEKLNGNKYIIPGLGDAGDRMFGVK
jgi:uracil phosphoribosyltransferase